LSLGEEGGTREEERLHMFMSVVLVDGLSECTIDVPGLAHCDDTHLCSHRHVALLDMRTNSFTPSSSFLQYVARLLALFVRLHF